MYTLFTNQYLWNKLWQCLDADGGHFEHLHWIQNSRTSLISILFLYKYSSYDYRVIFFMSKCVYIILGHYVYCNIFTMHVTMNVKLKKMFDFIMADVRNKLKFNKITQEILGYINKCFGRVKDLWCISSLSKKHFNYINTKAHIKIQFVPQGSQPILHQKG